MRRQVFTAAVVFSLAAPAVAIDIHCRIVEQLGSEHDDYAVLNGDRIVVRPGSSHRLRVQFMATAEKGEDVATFVGWTVGAINTTGGKNTRTGRAPNPHPRGRLVPFTFAPTSEGSEGLPQDDPFTTLLAIDCTAGQEALVWDCGDHKPEPPSRGVGVFVSTYEITTVAGVDNYEITIAGNAIAAGSWRTTGCDVPKCGDPDDPFDDVPGSCTYYPFTDDPQPLTSTLSILICPAEWNDDRAVNSQDFFDFLGDFFSGDADFNSDKVTDSQDFFDYLAAFFTAC